MKPYKIGKVWIDLDSVQSISEPKMCGNWSIRIEAEYQNLLHAWMNRDAT